MSISLLPGIYCHYAFLSSAKAPVTLCRVWATSCGELQLAKTLQMSYRTRTHVFACRRDVSSCRQYSSSSHENFKQFKIVVRVFVSYTTRRHVEGVSPKLEHVWYTCLHLSPLLVMWKVVRHATSLAASLHDKNTISARHAARLHDFSSTSVRVCTCSVRHVLDIAASCGELWRSYKRGCSFVFQDKYSGSLQPLHISTRHACKEKNSAQSLFVSGSRAWSSNSCGLSFFCFCFFCIVPNGELRDRLQQHLLPSGPEVQCFWGAGAGRWAMTELETDPKWLDHQNLYPIAICRPYSYISRSLLVKTRH